MIIEDRSNIIKYVIEDFKLGVGDKGYQTLELRLVGPILAITGAVLVLCRVMLCFAAIL